MSTSLHLSLAVERWPILDRFVTAHEALTRVDVVVVELAAGGVRGRGECAPYARYRETPASVVQAIEAARPALEAGVDRAELDRLLSTPSGRSAVDNASWDLEAKLSGRRVWELAGLPAPGPVTTAFTLSLDTPDAMGAAARREAARPLLKVKLRRRRRRRAPVAGRP